MRAKHMLHLEAVPAPFPCPLCPSQSELAGILTVQNPQTCCVCVKGTRSTEEGLLRPFQGTSPLQLLPRWPRVSATGLPWSEPSVRWSALPLPVLWHRRKAAWRPSTISLERAVLTRVSSFNVFCNLARRRISQIITCSGPFCRAVLPSTSLFHLTFYYKQQEEPRLRLPCCLEI